MTPKQSHIDKVVGQAMCRLRQIAWDRAVYKNGKLIAEGYPTPGDIEKELRKVYFLAIRKERRSK